jgi:hypothetical protein
MVLAQGRKKRYGLVDKLTASSNEYDLNAVAYIIDKNVCDMEYHAIWSLARRRRLPANAALLGVIRRLFKERMTKYHSSPLKDAAKVLLMLSTTSAEYILSCNPDSVGPEVSSLIQESGYQGPALVWWLIDLARKPEYWAVKDLVNMLQTREYPITYDQLKELVRFPDEKHHTTIRDNAATLDPSEKYESWEALETIDYRSLKELARSVLIARHQ